MSYDEFKKKGCPRCGGQEFELGPRGGLSQMFRCRWCEQEFVAYPAGVIELVER